LALILPLLTVISTTILVLCLFSISRKLWVSCPPPSLPGCDRRLLLFRSFWSTAAAQPFFCPLLRIYLPASQLSCFADSCFFLFPRWPLRLLFHATPNDYVQQPAPLSLSLFLSSSQSVSLLPPASHHDSQGGRDRLTQLTNLVRTLPPPPPEENETAIIRLGGNKFYFSFIPTAAAGRLSSLQSGRPPE
jgi:hypothetical protein